MTKVTLSYYCYEDAVLLDKNLILWSYLTLIIQLKIMFPLLICKLAGYIDNRYSQKDYLC